jgi:CheY-like chemotaxis protein
MPTPRQILVVDDDESIRDLVTPALGVEGYEVVSALDMAKPAYPNLRGRRDPGRLRRQALNRIHQASPQSSRYQGGRRR